MKERARGVLARVAEASFGVYDGIITRNAESMDGALN